MKKFKGLFSQSITLIALSFIFIDSAHSTRATVSIPASSNQTCQEAINSVGKDLASKGAFVPHNTDLPQVGRVEPKVSIKKGNFYQNYYDYPTNRPQMVEFILSGEMNRLSQGVMSSPNFLATSTAKIMADCPQVGMVKFQHWWEGFVPVGYFSDSTARTFTWINPYNSNLGEARTRNGKYQWGYYSSN
jgi:hypothetical protein